MSRRLLSTVLEILGALLLAVVLWHFSIWFALGFVGAVLIFASWVVDGDKR